MPVFPSQRDPPSPGTFARRQLATAGAILLLVSSAAVADHPAAELLRRQYGLRRISGGDVWLLPEELQLQETLQELDPLYRAILGLQKRLTETAVQNRIVWEANRLRIDALRQQLGHSETDDPQRRQIEREIRQLESGSVEPAALAGVAHVRSMLIELINLRLRLALSVTAVRQLHQQISSDYQRLAAEPAVHDALHTLGESHRLGPLQQGYRSQLKRLDRYDQLLDTDWVPLYRQSDQTRFGGILHQRVPALFTWQDSAEATLVPTTLIDSAGLALPEDAEAVEVSLGGQRRLLARPIVLPTLQFGGVLLHDVPALVLPPEAEDVGARIGSQGFAGYTVELQPERLRLVITASD